MVILKPSTQPESRRRKVIQRSNPYDNHDQAIQKRDNLSNHSKLHKRIDDKVNIEQCKSSHSIRKNHFIRSENEKVVFYRGKILK